MLKLLYCYIFLSAFGNLVTIIHPFLGSPSPSNLGLMVVHKVMANVSLEVFKAKAKVMVLSCIGKEKKKEKN